MVKEGLDSTNKMQLANKHREKMVILQEIRRGTTWEKEGEQQEGG
jgi:aryl carrier-like protein